MQNPYRVKSISGVIASEYIAYTEREGKRPSVNALFRLLSDRIDTKPFVFKRNRPEGGPRIPLETRSAKEQALMRSIERVVERMAEQREGEPKHEPKREPERKKGPVERFLDEVQRLRRFCRDREQGGNKLDSLGLRPVQMARAAIEKSNIPPEAMLHAMCMHWAEDIRREAKVPTYDPADFAKAPAGSHKALPYALALVNAGLPVLCVGPMGSGKSTIARQVAAALEVEYAECPITAGATPSWLAGAYTLDGFIGRPFLDRYTEGGVFNFEELDAAEPNMLIVLNNALANDQFFNPVNGKRYPRSNGNNPFIPFATANTLGGGANREYTGRERQDAAALDRWRMGRIWVDVDEELERHIALG